MENIIQYGAFSFSMDEVDIVIFKELWKNSRITIRELSDKLGISVNSVHKRINNLVEVGIIECFFLRPNKLYPASLWVLLFGKSNSSELENKILKLGKKGNIFKAVQCLDNCVLIFGPLKDISEINNFTEDVVRELIMEDYILGIQANNENNEDTVSFSKLDYQICHSLAKNSRRPLLDVANELGVTPKTVKRRLTKMEKDGSVHTKFRWQPALGDMILSYMYLTIKPGISRQEITAYLSNDFNTHLLQYIEFSNLPNFLLTAFCGRTFGEISDIQQRLNESGKFKEITVNVQYKAYHFDTWMDDHIRNKAGIK